MNISKLIFFYLVKDIDSIFLKFPLGKKKPENKENIYLSKNDFIGIFYRIYHGLNLFIIKNSD